MHSPIGPSLLKKLMCLILISSGWSVPPFCQSADRLPPWRRISVLQEDGEYPDSTIGFPDDIDMFPGSRFGYGLTVSI